MSASKGSMQPRQLSTGQTIVAGAGAGLCELLIMYPLDVVKTRQQLASGGNASSGVYEALRSVVREGGVSRLYRGMLAPSVQEPVKRSIKFTVNAKLKSMVREQTIGTSFLCGACAGSTEAMLISPFEVVKVRMQAADRLSVYASSQDCAMKILSSEGPLGLMRGVESAMWRSGVWNGTYFSVVYALKRSVLPHSGDSHGLEMLRNFTAGLIGGICGTALNNPFDVVVSRMRNVLPGEVSPYRFAIPSLVHLARQEGVPALYQGFRAKVLRLGPGGGIMMCAFDLAKSIMLASD